MLLRHFFWFYTSWFILDFAFSLAFSTLGFVKKDDVAVSTFHFFFFVNWWFSTFYLFIQLACLFTFSIFLSSTLNSTLNRSFWLLLTWFTMGGWFFLRFFIYPIWLFFGLRLHFRWMNTTYSIYLSFIITFFFNWLFIV